MRGQDERTPLRRRSQEKGVPRYVASKGDTNDAHGAAASNQTVLQGPSSSSAPAKSWVRKLGHFRSMLSPTPESSPSTDQLWSGDTGQAGQYSAPCTEKGDEEAVSGNLDAWREGGKGAEAGHLPASGSGVRKRSRDLQHNTKHENFSSRYKQWLSEFLGAYFKCFLSS